MLIRKGAEASLFLENWEGRKVIMKRRLPKEYRLEKIDKKIRTHRTLHESQLLHEAKEAGIPTPTIFMVDLADSNIILEFIQGKQVKQILRDLSEEERRHLCEHIGTLIARLHNKDIIHGDLTTSNMILNPNGKVVFLDFGLAEKTVELELKGVDLHLMKRALQSTHFDYSDECFKDVLYGYSEVAGREVTQKVLRKICEIERRGRYISDRRRPTDD
jgi:TP53 regulating kinase-like protein